MINIQTYCAMRNFRQPNDGDKQGRLSGSSTWRLARGEIQANEDNLHFVWLVTGDAATIRYSSAMDEYEFIENEKRVVTKKNWFSGVFQHKNMFRKQEQDWKMVYLCRKGEESKKLMLNFVSVFALILQRMKVRVSLNGRLRLMQKRER